MHQEHEALLGRWRQLPKHAGKVFIADGIIDPARWERAPRRVLLLLKEAYSTEQEAFYLRAWLRENGPRYNIWRNVAKWAYALQNWTETNHPSAPEDLQILTEALLSVAVVNIKKSDGQTQSRQEDLMDYAMADGEYLHRQIELINPDLILCGSTLAYVLHVWKDESFRSGHPQVWKVAGRPVIEFWHPAVHWPHSLLYHALGGMLSASGLAQMPRR
ncbi:MAG: hypothetical protein ACOY94_22965 [Bacillota bacterium]